jgi:hypothetical protein
MIGFRILIGVLLGFFRIGSFWFSADRIGSFSFADTKM